MAATTVEEIIAQQNRQAYSRQVCAEKGIWQEVKSKENIWKLHSVLTKSFIIYRTNKRKNRSRLLQQLSPFLDHRHSLIRYNITQRRWKMRSSALSCRHLWNRYKTHHKSLETTTAYKRPIHPIARRSTRVIWLKLNKLWRKRWWVRDSQWEPYLLFWPEINWNVFQEKHEASLKHPQSLSPQVSENEDVSWEMYFLTASSH